MHRRRLLLSGVIGAGALAMAGTKQSKGANMAEIRFDLGKNIVETAKQSGVPAYASRDVQGYISYGVSDVPPEVVAVYTRAGFEIRWSGLYAFTLYADRQRSPELRVQTATLQQRSDFSSHRKAQAFIDKTVAQFKQGKWRRYFLQDQARLTGRSSILHENGSPDPYAAAPDPDYAIPPEDWSAMMGLGLQWRWLGDGVLATLSASTVGERADGSPDYSIDLDFEDEAIARQTARHNEAEKLKSLDAKGANATAQAQAARIKQQELNKVLEANAVKRGDRVLPPAP
jgi:hypothetical protein